MWVYLPGDTEFSRYSHVTRLVEEAGFREMDAVAHVGRWARC